MSMRAFVLAVTGLALSVTACSTYGTSVVETNNKTPAHVASVSISVPRSLATGQTARGVAVPKDANGNALAGRAVTWFTSSQSIATVNDSGTIVAVAPGTAVVSAVSEGVAGQAAMSITPPTPTPIANVTVIVSPSSVLIGQTAHATATLSDSTGKQIVDRTITWQSSNSSIATIAQSGDVTAVGPGTAMISASSDGKTAGSALTVAVPPPIPVATVSVSPSTANLQVGAKVQLSAVTSDANNNVLTGRTVTWTSGNASLATVSSSGLVTAVAAGNVNISASSEGQMGSASVAISAPAPIPVATVSVSPTTSTLQIAGTAQLSAVTRDANNNVLTGRVVTWSSANSAVATVSASGLVTAIAAGNTSIAAVSEGISGTSAITVSAPAVVASVSVSPASPTVQAGASVQLSATLRDASGNVLTGRTVTWASTNTSVATVSASGLVRGVAAGNASVNATSGGITGSASITVSAPPPPPPPGSSPEPGAGDVVMWQDNFDGSTISDLTAPYSTRGPLQLTDGHSGQGIRFPYNNASSDNLIEKSFPVTTDIYFRYWYRLSPGADPTCGNQGQSGFKWFMPWRITTVLRYTMGVGNLPGGPSGSQNTGLEFSSHDNTSTGEPNPFMQNISKAKTFKSTADGAWHEYTLHIVTGNGGYEQIWIDGVLILDNSGYNYDHDPNGIGLIQFPGTVVQWFSGCDFTVDVDDLAIWHK